MSGHKNYENDWADALLDLDKTIKSEDGVVFLALLDRTDDTLAFYKTDCNGCATELLTNLAFKNEDVMQVLKAVVGYTLVQENAPDTMKEGGGE